MLSLPVFIEGLVDSFLDTYPLVIEYFLQDIVPCIYFLVPKPQSKQERI